MTQYEVKDGCVIVSEGGLQEFDAKFDVACQELLESDKKELCFDLSLIKYINSTCVGMIAATFFAAKDQDKDVRIIGNPSIIRILRTAGFARFIELEIKEEAGK